MRYLIAVSVMLFCAAGFVAFLGEPGPMFMLMALASQNFYYIGCLHERSKIHRDNASGGDHA